MAPPDRVFFRVLVNLFIQDENGAEYGGVGGKFVRLAEQGGEPKLTPSPTPP